jgi:hypothetical protein
MAPATRPKRYGPGYVETYTVIAADGTERTGTGAAALERLLRECPGFRGFRRERVWGNLVELGR